jgi:AraC-like DNA-binding protein
MDPSFERIQVDRFEPERLVEVVSDGHFEHRLLDGGSFQAKLERLILPATRVDSGCFSRPCFARGAFPAGWMCIGFTLTQQDGPALDGVKLSSRDLQVYSEGMSLDYRSAPHSPWMALQVRRDLLQETALRVIGCELDLPVRGYRNIRLPAAASAVLRNGFQIALRQGALLTGGPFDAWAARGIECNVLSAAVRALHIARRRSHERSTRGIQRRMRIVQTAEQFLKSHVDRPFRVEDLALATQTSERVLENLFQDAYGVSPREWFLSGRLHAVRHELASASTSQTSVSAAAARWGIKHLGRFAGRYRELFGELPSETLANRPMLDATGQQ